MSVSREDIQEWKREGWSFRVKKVKGKQYITRRKGNEERGLGRYNESLWRQLIDDDQRQSEINRKKELKKVVKDMIQLDMGSKMGKTCVHNFGGFCHFIEFDNKPAFASIMDKEPYVGEYKKIKNENGSEYWVFGTEFFYCFKCPAYKASK